MTAEEKTIKIAEICGWASQKVSGEVYYEIDSGHWVHTAIVLDDLNVMRRALATFEPGTDLDARTKKQIFIRELAKQVDTRNAPDWPDCDSYGRFCVISLIFEPSAEDYANAFLITHGFQP